MAFDPGLKSYDMIPSSSLMSLGSYRGSGAGSLRRVNCSGNALVSFPKRFSIDPSICLMSPSSGLTCINNLTSPRSRPCLERYSCLMLAISMSQPRVLPSLPFEDTVTDASETLSTIDSLTYGQDTHALCLRTAFEMACDVSRRSSTPVVMSLTLSTRDSFLDFIPNISTCALSSLP